MNMWVYDADWSGIQYVKVCNNEVIIYRLLKSGIPHNDFWGYSSNRDTSWECLLRDGTYIRVPGYEEV